MADLSSALAVAKPALAAIAETTTALMRAVADVTTDLAVIEKELVATGVPLEFLMWEPIRHTERRFIEGEGKTKAMDIAWCLGFCRTAPSEDWHLIVREYYREYDPAATHAPLRIVREETPVTEASPELRMAAMGHIFRFLDLFLQHLRQTLTSIRPAQSGDRGLARSRATPPAVHSQ